MNDFNSTPPSHQYWIEDISEAKRLTMEALTQVEYLGLNPFKYYHLPKNKNSEVDFENGVQPNYQPHAELHSLIIHYVEQIENSATKLPKIWQKKIGEVEIKSQNTPYTLTVTPETLPAEWRMQSLTYTHEQNVAGMENKKTTHELKVLIPPTYAADVYRFCNFALGELGLATQVGAIDDEDREGSKTPWQQ